MEENFDKLTPEEMFNKIEASTSDSRFGHHDKFAKILKKLENSDNRKLFEEMKMELWVRDLSTQFNVRDKRFNPMMSGTLEDGTPWEYPNIKKDFSEKSIEYYKKRINTTKNPISKARYCDFLWYFKKDIKYAKEAIEAYLECAEIYLTNDWGMELADSLLRALEISKSIGDEELKKKSISKILKIIDGLRKIENYRFLIEMMGGLIQVPDYVNLNSLIPVIEEAIVYFQDNKDDSYNLQRDFLNLLVKIYKEDEKKEEVRLRIVKNLIEEAEWKETHYPQGKLVASSIYEQALKMYQDLGKYSEEVEKLKVVIQDLNKSTQENFKVIKAEITIPNKVIDNYLLRFKEKNIREMIELVCVDKGLIPDYNKSRESAIQQTKDFAFRNIVPVSIFKGNLRLKTITGEEEKLEFSSIRNFMMEYKVVSQLLSKIFDSMEEKDSEYSKEIAKFIAESTFIKKMRLPLISAGLNSFKNKDYVASIHILIFQIEGILRDMLESMEISTFTYNRNQEMRARMLSGMVKTLFLVEGLDKNLIKFIDIFLSNILGDNLRNGVGHSLCEIEEFSKENNLLLILIILKICSYKIIKLPNKK